jgi:hypothetical protein
MARFNVNYIEWRTVTTAVPAIASLCSVHPLDQAEHKKKTTKQSGSEQ